jgi:SAM-dependent methyltransferase
MPDNRMGVVARVVRRVRRWSDGVTRGPHFLVSPQSGTSMGPDGLPLPPPRLMRLVAGTDDVEWFLRSGLLAANSMRGILARSGVTIERLGTILDFGCGSGRVLRHWKSLDGPALHGTDYNPDLVAWCAASLPFANLGVNRLDRQLGYPDATFDLIYAFSVLTHIPLEGQSFWIAELTRVLRPGGVLFVTTQGEHYLPQLAFADQERFRSGQLVVLHANRPGTDDCATFHPESYVRESLAQGLDVVDFIPEGALGNPYQDAYLLRKPG